MLPVCSVTYLGICNNSASQIFHYVIIHVVTNFSAYLSVLRQARTGVIQLLLTVASEAPACELSDDGWAGGQSWLLGIAMKAHEQVAGNTVLSSSKCMVLSERDRTFHNL